MSISSLIEKKVVDSLDYTSSIQDVVNQMIKSNIRYIILIKDNKPSAILTETDITSIYAKHINFDSSAYDIATKKLFVANKEKQVDYILSLMLNNSIRRVVIVDDDGTYLCTVTQEDIIYVLDKDVYKANIQIKQLINKSNRCHYIYKEDSLQDVVNIMNTLHIGALIVYDKDEEIIGIITETDILQLAHNHIDTSKKVYEFMHSPIIFFDSNELLFDVVDKLKEKNIRRAIVLDNNEYYVVSTKDIIKNIQGNYGQFLESKIEDNNKTLDALNEAVIDLINSDDNQTIHWCNKKAKEIFKIEADDDITKVIPSDIWKNIYAKVHNLTDRTLEVSQILDIDNKTYNITVFNSNILENRLIKLIFSDISNQISKYIYTSDKFKTLYDEAPLSYQSLDSQGNILNVNNKWVEMLGYPQDEVVETHISQYVCKSDLMKLKSSFKAFLENKKVNNVEFNMKKKDGSEILVSVDGRISYDNGNFKTHCILQDITKKRAYEKKLKQALVVFENTNEGIMVTNRDNNIISINSAFTKITKYTIDDVLGKNPNIMKSYKQNSEFYKNMWKKISQDGFWSGEIFNRNKNGEIYLEWLSVTALKNSYGEIENYIAVFSDITKIKESESMITYLSHNDTLTNLPNRLLLFARLEHSMSIALEKYKNLVIISINIDNLKRINDSFGHIVGDEVLIEVAQRLNSVTKHNDTLARVSGDEFVLVLEDVDSQKNIISIIERINKEIKKDIVINNHTFNITVCSGIAIYPNNGIKSEDLIKHSETALHNAKKLGIGSFEFYNENMTSEVLEKILIEKDIQEAMKNYDFEVYYQPQIDIKRKKVIGAEALVRWNHKSKGLLTPNEFLEHAASTKQIIPLGEYILDDACTFFKELDDKKILIDGKIAVNLAGEQIVESDIVATIKNTLQKSKLAPKNLELEVVETYIMKDIDESIKLFKKLKELGVKLAIDDFGTGYSSLSYIKQFPIDKLKIDKSFIDGVPSNKKDDAIVKTIIALGKGLDLNIIAEGVERDEQKEFLESQDCDEIQGWLYSKALKKSDFIEFVKGFK